MKIFQDEQQNLDLLLRKLQYIAYYVGGGYYYDIWLYAGISMMAFHWCMHCCMNAILQCDRLKYIFPTTAQEIEQSIKEFAEISTNQVIDGCVGCIDGFLLQIQTPSATETGNVKAYFSGHY